MRSTSARRPTPAAGTSSKTATIREVNNAASTELVSGQRRYTVGLLTRARLAISAKVTRSIP
ncbi:hypothetical protein MPUL_42940 [Mycolicibacterium pulveris]|uniref:Uncharacterized protein n=1 Tax=Mycolicibacterium pulveris TaxID=36813 RepID=A0A7I7USU5_MYCPV|nr:hypothetical protein MPUL_42940 [Mycolicibacterium pulveris]